MEYLRTLASSKRRAERISKSPDALYPVENEIRSISGVYLPLSLRKRLLWVCIEKSGQRDTEIPRSIMKNSSKS